MKQNRKPNLIERVTMLGAMVIAIAMLLMPTKTMAATIIKNVAFTGVQEPGIGKNITFDIQAPAGAGYEAKYMYWYEMLPTGDDMFENIVGYANNDDSGSIDLIAMGKPEITKFSANRIYLLSIQFNVKEGFELDENFVCTVNGREGAGTKSEDMGIIKTSNNVMIAYMLDASGKLTSDKPVSDESSGTPSAAPSTKPSTTPSTAPSTKPSTTPSKTPSKNPGKETSVTLQKGKITKVSPAKKKMVVKWSKDKNAKSYEVQYSLKSSMKNAKIKAVKGASKTSVTIKSLKSKKNYYVRVRSVNGKTKGEWSKVVRTKVK